MEESKSNSGLVLGIVAFVTSLLAIIFAFFLGWIPFVGFFAVIPAIIAIVLAAVGLSMAKKNNSSRGFSIAGLVIGIFAVLMVISINHFTGKFFRNFTEGDLGEKIEKVINEVQEDMIKDLKDANISIKVENGNEKVEISLGVEKSDREKTLEELEEGKTIPADTVDGGK